jgi:hypothetical protein
VNGAQYFEEHPWKRACRLIEEQKLGPVHQVIVQCICKKEALQSSFAHWREQVTLLAGEEQAGNLLEAKNVISYVGQFGDTVVRLFFDAAGMDTCENFEIVAEGGLLVWKPVAVNQGHIYSADGCELVCSQKYMEELEVTL